MFNLFKKNSSESEKFVTLTLKITGMHCTSCSINIDDALEDTVGVLRANTNFAKAKTVISYEPDKVTPEALKKVISDLGYVTN